MSDMARGLAGGSGGEATQGLDAVVEVKCSLDVIALDNSSISKFPLPPSRFKMQYAFHVMLLSQQ